MTLDERAEDPPADAETAGCSSGILDVRIRFTSSLPMVRLAGELDRSSVHLVRDALESLTVADCTATTVLLDLGQVTFCDVEGLRVVEEAAAALTAVGKELVLYSVPDSVTRVITVTGVASGLTTRGGDDPSG